MRTIKIYNPSQPLYPAIAACIRRKDLLLTTAGDHPTITNKVVIKDRNLEVHGISAIIHYLDEKFPHPPLFPPEPEKRALIRMATDQFSDSEIAAILENYRQNIPDSHFFSGEQPSVLDTFLFALADEDITDWQQFRERF